MTDAESWRDSGMEKIRRSDTHSNTLAASDVRSVPGRANKNRHLDLTGLLPHAAKIKLASVTCS